MEGKLLAYLFYKYPWDLKYVIGGKIAGRADAEDIFLMDDKISMPIIESLIDQQYANRRQTLRELQARLKKRLEQPGEETPEPARSVPR